MALVKDTLKASILAILVDFQNQELTGPQAADRFADKLATAIDAYIRTGTVITTGSATTQTGTIT